MLVRLTYATFRSEAAAVAALEDFFAGGEISQCERPRIERRGRRWHVTLLTAS